MRFTAPLLALLFAVVLNAPSLYLLDFELHKAYIIRELCVQRDVVESMRTCHGDCQLSKKFKAMEEQADASFPAERLQIRTEPMVQHNVAAPILVRLSSPLHFRVFEEGLRSGHREVSEPVPWC